MTAYKKPRVMWLLNHGTARKFDVAMLKQIGIEEIFLPKKYPDDISFRSASVDYSEDVNLTIPADELAVLNDANWYASPSPEAWDIANRHFDILFFITHFGSIVKNIVDNYKGIVLWRAFGLDRSLTYTKVLNYLIGTRGKNLIKSMGKRFYFAQAYDHLPHIEADFLSQRALFLPLGLPDCHINDTWRGSDPNIFFICPDLGFNPYYQDIYNQFVKDFKGLSYAVGGAQPISVADPNVLGYVPEEVHKRNMREMRVMFYHSTEPNHIHYHPFEAIKVGMPLVFMAGGMLDRMGGKNLPGRCKNSKEARYKIERILNDDWSLIEDIRESQVCLLDQMKPENCVDAWRVGFESIFSNLEKVKANQPLPIKETKRIAVILPIEYKGGSLRGAKLLAQAIDHGARQAGKSIEVIFCHLDDYYTDEDFADLPLSIKRRPYNWRILNREEATRAMIYAGLEETLKYEKYIVADDQCNQLMECDLFVIISDRLSIPLLPIKPYIVMIYDYLQRYEKIISAEENQCFIRIAHFAERVLVTTEFTRSDAIQFAGLLSEKVIKLPMLTPQFALQQGNAENELARRYFLWTTNEAIHKNHENALKALSLYYEKYEGQLECHVTGINTKNLTKSDLPHLKPLREIVAQNIPLKRNLKLLGDLTEPYYHLKLQSSQFLWHAGRIDNGTFSVVEAAHFGVPALSSDYPAMREINAQFNLNLNWMDAYNPEDMAIQLKKMEVEASALKSRVPSAESLSSQSVEKLSGVYWKAIKECL
ncbi:MAG: glycosytransferase [Alphaproteobacteria bacterium 41-28]|nr:MAG: glycosytransferase [Alphaproteobacteria bacterium 41-28]